MRPFQWPHVSVPLLPANLVELLEAPVPILVGVPTIPGLQTEFYSDLVWVKLDYKGKGSKVECRNREVMQGVRELYADNLKGRLTPLLKTLGTNRNPFQIEPLCREVVEGIQMISAYWRQISSFIPPKSRLSTDTFLDQEELRKVMLARVTKADAPFISSFVSTQIFLSHIENR